MPADLTQSFLKQHVEKIVLAAAIAVFVVAFGYFCVMRKPQDSLRTEVARTVEDIKKRVSEPSLDKALTKEERVELGIDEPLMTAAVFERRLNGLPEAWTTLAKMVERQYEPVGPVGPTVVEVTGPAKVLPVESVEVAIGRGVTNETVPNPLAKLETKTPCFDFAWVGCVGKFDLTAQLREYVKGGAEPQEIIISKVELQRREMKPDGTWTEWQVVPPAVPPALVTKLPKMPASPQDKRAVGEWYINLRKMQAEIRRMPFYKLVAKDAEGQTVQDVAGQVTGVEQPSLKIVEPKAEEEPAATVPAAAPPPEPPPGPGPRPPSSGVPSWLVETAPERSAGPATPVQPSVKRVEATVWANDVTVSPGRTYQYRMRVAVFNPVYSLPNVKDDKTRWALEFPGEWSDPTPTVTVPGLVQFYFVGTFRDKANLELHRWVAGQWVIVPSAPANLGAPVVFIKPRHELQVPGSKDRVRQDIDLSPQVVLVDVITNFPYQPEGNMKPIRTNILVFADAQGRLTQRIEWEDRKAATNARIERQEGATAAPKPPGPGATPATPKPTQTKPPAPRRPAERPER